MNRKIPKYNCNIWKISKEIWHYICKKKGVNYINKSKVLFNLNNCNYTGVSMFFIIGGTS